MDMTLSEQSKYGVLREGPIVAYVPDDDLKSYDNPPITWWSTVVVPYSDHVWPLFVQGFRYYSKRGRP